MTHPRKIACALALLSSLAGGAALARAEGQTFRTHYDVSLIGLPVGEASFDTMIDGGTFSVNGKLASKGLADLVAKTSGTSAVSGRIADDRLYAQRYQLAYKSGRKSWSSEVAMQAGRVRSANVAPKRDKPKPDYVPVTDSQLAAVVDPLSGLMIKADGASVCARTLPFFDGWSRLDLKLTAAGERPFSANGYSGKAVICNVRVEPVSGFEKSSKGLNFIKERTIEVWFAPIGSTDIYAPVYARIPTEIGPLTLTATTFAKK